MLKYFRLQVGSHSGFGNLAMFVFFGLCLLCVSMSCFLVLGHTSDDDDEQPLLLLPLLLTTSTTSALASPRYSY